MNGYKKIMHLIEHHFDIIKGYILHYSRAGKVSSNDFLETVERLEKECMKKVGNVLNPKYYKGTMFINWNFLVENGKDKLNSHIYNKVDKAYENFCRFKYLNYEKKRKRRLMELAITSNIDKYVKFLRIFSEQINRDSINKKEETEREESEFKRDIVIKSHKIINNNEINIDFQFKLKLNRIKIYILIIITTLFLC